MVVRAYLSGDLPCLCHCLLGFLLKDGLGAMPKDFDAFISLSILRSLLSVSALKKPLSVKW